MARRLPLSLGLRAQIILALCGVFVLSSGILGVTAVRLTQHALRMDRSNWVKTLAASTALVVDRLPEPSDDQLNMVFSRLLHTMPNSAIRIQRKDGTRYSYGTQINDYGTEIELADGGRLQLYVPALQTKSSTPLTNLLLFYVSLTGAAVVLFTYLALTYWIVRPIESLTRSSELLASGTRYVRVPVRGPAEVTQLAVSFNRMATQLRAERHSLELRLSELESTTRDLKAAQQQIIHGEKLATVGRLAAGVAHEIGNPLSAILGLVELLQGGSLLENERVEFLIRIGLETERINRIIRDLLDFSRRSADSEELSMTSNLEQVIDDAVNLVNPLKEMQAIDVSISRPDTLPRVVGPQHRLTQVVLNILLNAADALNGKGDIRISAEVSPKQDLVFLTISDNGPGIDSDIMDRIFEPFTTTKPVGKGTGLGLAVCHTLVESLGGRVIASNLPEGGACFRVQLKAQSRL